MRTYKQADRQIEKQPDMKTERGIQAGRQTDRKMMKISRLTDDKDKNTYLRTCRQADRQKEKQPDINTERHTGMQTDRTGSQTDRQADSFKFGVSTWQFQEN